MTDPARPGSDSGARPQSPPPAGSALPPGGFAVVEMFTSQGCNSCPPAEELLTEIEREARHEGQPVYALGFHVDYWDDLGWPDPFADPAYTARQQSYARAFGSGGLYTPQMIVNGTVEFVGSDRRRASTAISAALTEATTTPLALSVAAEDAGRRMVVDYRIERPPKQSVLNVAVVERDLENHVLRGENAGRTLRQDNVVRAFTSVGPATPTGRVEVAVPPGLDPERASVVGYLQHHGNKAIIGAAAVDVATG